MLFNGFIKTMSDDYVDTSVITKIERLNELEYAIFDEGHVFLGIINLEALHVVLQSWPDDGGQP